MQAESLDVATSLRSEVLFLEQKPFQSSKGASTLKAAGGTLNRQQWGEARTEAKGLRGRCPGPPRAVLELRMQLAAVAREAHSPLRLTPAWRCWPCIRKGMPWQWR